jgi:hypothetical protein
LVYGVRSARQIGDGGSFHCVFFEWVFGRIFVQKSGLSRMAAFYGADSAGRLRVFSGWLLRIGFNSKILKGERIKWH